MKTLLCLLFLFSANALACNNLRIENLGNVDLNTNPNPTETFTVKRSGNKGCSFFVTVDDGSAWSYASRRLVRYDHSATIPVQICADTACSKILKHFPEISSTNDVLSGTFPDGQHSPQEIEFVLRPQLGGVGYGRFGSYDDNFAVRVYEGTFGWHSLEDTDTFNIRYTVSKKIDLSVVNTGSPFDPGATSKTLDFGRLATAKAMSFDLVLKYNAGYQVKLSSENDGALKNATSSYKIPYALVVNGSLVDLSGSSHHPQVVGQGWGASPDAGKRLPGTVTIGPVNSATQAGSYQDVITITVTTTE
jgi:hypothetical protein